MKNKDAFTKCVKLITPEAKILSLIYVRSYSAYRQEAVILCLVEKANGWFY